MQMRRLAKPPHKFQSGTFLSAFARPPQEAKANTDREASVTQRKEKDLFIMITSAECEIFYFYSRQKRLMSARGKTERGQRK